jgi:hypothetical protein
MNQNWKIRVQSADCTPFAFKATFVGGKTGRDENALDVRYAYGDGDLAVLLEDLGAGAPDICRLISALHERASAVIEVEVSEEAMEVLARMAVPGVRGRRV